MNDTYYFIWIGVGILLSFFLYALTLKKRRIPEALVTMAASVVSGFVFSKLLYILLQLNFALEEGIGSVLVNINPEKFSFIGGILGVCLAVALCGKIFEGSAMKALDRFAPAGLFLAAVMRFGEYFLSNQYMTGLGLYIDEESPLAFFPLAINRSTDPDWGDWRLAVFAIEGVILLILALVSLLCFKKNRFIRSLFWMCVPSVILENMLINIFWWIWCVRVEQLLYAVAMLVILVIYAVRLNKESTLLRVMTILSSVIGIGLIAVAEFAMEGKIEFLSFMNVGACYGLMAFGCALPAIMEIICSRKLSGNKNS